MIYNTKEGELTGLQTLIASERNSEKPVLFFVRVARPDNSTLLFSLPDRWKGIDLARIGDISINRSVLPSYNQYHLHPFFSAHTIWCDKFIRYYLVHSEVRFWICVYF